MRKINFGSKLSLELLLTDLKRKKNDDWLPFPVSSSLIVVTVCLVFKKLATVLRPRTSGSERRVRSSSLYTLLYSSSKAKK